MNTMRLKKREKRRGRARYKNKWYKVLLQRIATEGESFILSLRFRDIILRRTVG